MDDEPAVRHAPVVKVPHGWTVHRLGNLGHFSTSSVDKKESPEESPVCLVNYMDVYRHQFIDGSIQFMRVTAPTSQLERSQLQKGDILFTPSSETPDDIGRSAVVRSDLPGTLHSYHTVRLRPNGDQRLDLDFSGWFANAPYVLSQFSRLASGSTRFTLSLKDFKQVTVVLPPLREQRKIAAVLAAVDDAVTASRKVIEQTKRMKQALLQTLLTRGIGHTRFQRTSVGEIPETWELTSLGDLAQFQNGKAIKPGQWQDEGLPIIRIPQLTAQHDIEHWIDPEQVESRYLVEAGDLLFSWSGSLTIARWAGQRAALNQHVFNVRPRPDVDDGFLEFLLKYNVRALEARTHGTTMRHITKRSLLNFVTVRPPIEEQQEISRRLAAVQATERCHATAKEFLKALRRGLMQDLLTGRVRVQPD